MAFVVIFVAVVIPSLKKTPKGDPRRQDVFFQVSGLVLLLAVLVVSFGGLDYPVGSFKSPLNVAGAVLFIISLIVRVSAHLTLNTNYSWTLEIREGHAFVDYGLYRYVRHPIYLGTFIGVIAIPVYSSSFLGLLLGFLAIPVLSFRIGIEESMLIEEFGEEYRRYQERTWRLFPFLY